MALMYNFFLILLSCVLSLRANEPKLRKYGDPVRVLENTDLMLDIESSHLDRPGPIRLRWFLNGVMREDDYRRSFDYPYMMMRGVRRSDAGNYSLHVTIIKAGNFQVINTSFLLDVVYGPFVTTGPTKKAGMLFDTLTLECGTVVSNPMASVIWFDPNGMEVVENDRYDLVNDDRGIQLTIHRTMNSDIGNWTCSVKVEVADVRVGNSISDTLKLGGKNFTISLVVLVAPGTPRTVMVVSIGHFWALLAWQTPVERGEPPVIGRYVITAATPGITGALATTTTDNSTRFNVTDLLPGTSYNFSVQGVTTALGVEAIGESSSVVTGTTGTTVPELTCETESENGGLRISWSFAHTGGLPLTNTLVEYLVNGLPIDRMNLPPVRTNDRTVLVPRLTAGTLYHFRITASNSFGQYTSDCQSTILHIGIPGVPKAPEVSSSTMGPIHLRISTDFPGVAEGEAIIFIVHIALARTGHRVARLLANVSSYLAGEVVEVTIPSNANLRVRVKYEVTVEVRNTFGTSELSTPVSFLATRGSAGSVDAGRVTSGVTIALVGVVLILSGIGLIIVQISYHQKFLAIAKQNKLRKLNMQT